MAWQKWAIAAVLIGLMAASGCKKDADPPPPETDPDKLKKIEQQVEQAGQREGQGQK